MNYLFSFFFTLETSVCKSYGFLNGKGLCFEKSRKAISLDPVQCFILNQKQTTTSGAGTYLRDLLLIKLWSPSRNLGLCFFEGNLFYALMIDPI